jgi:hypothetical protein
MMPERTAALLLTWMGSHLCHLRTRVSGDHHRRADAARCPTAPDQAWATVDLKQRRYFETEQMRAGGCLAPLVIVTVTVGDEEPLPGSKKLKMKQWRLSYDVRFVVFCFGGGVFYVIKLLIESHHL